MSSSSLSSLVFVFGELTLGLLTACLASTCGKCKYAGIVIGAAGAIRTAGVAAAVARGSGLSGALPGGSCGAGCVGIGGRGLATTNGGIAIVDGGGRTNDDKSATASVHSLRSAAAAPMANRKRGRSEELIEGNHSKKIAAAVEKYTTNGNMHHRNVAAIMIGILNPEMTGLGLRYHAEGGSEETAIYYCWDMPSSPEVFPQGTVLLNLADQANPTAATATAIPNDHGPMLVYTCFLFHSLMRRWIQEDKNPGAKYWAGRAYGQDGRTEFTVDVVANITELTDIKFGGCTFAPDVLSSNSAAFATGADSPYNAANFAAPNTNQGLNLPAGPAFKDFHDGVLAPIEFRGDTFLYCDGCSLAAPSNTAATSTRSYIAGCTPGTNGFISAPTAVNKTAAAKLLTGSINFAHGSKVLVTGTQFAIKIFGYRSGQPYELANTAVEGIITEAAPVVDQVFASIPLGQADYWKVQFATLAKGGAQAAPLPQGATIKIWFINNGEIWRHRQAPFAKNNIQNVTSHRGLATTLLTQNSTAPNYKAGDGVSAQLPLGQDWMTVAKSGDPFSFCNRTLKSRTRPFAQGHYTWLRPADPKETMELQKEVTATATSNEPQFVGTGSTEKFTYSVKAFKVPTAVQSISVPEPGGGTKQTFLQTLAAGGEYATPNQWAQDGITPYTRNDWTDAIDGLSTIEPGFENPEHDAETLEYAKAGGPRIPPRAKEIMQGMGTKGVVEPELKEGVLDWIDPIVDTVKKVAPLAISALPYIL